MMPIKLFVAPLPLSYTDAQLAALFSDFGTPIEVTLVRGPLASFGFVTLEARAAMCAVEGLHRKVGPTGRRLEVTEAGLSRGGTHA
jgi:hypothetical protein